MVRIGYLMSLSPSMGAASVFSVAIVTVFLGRVVWDSKVSSVLGLAPDPSPAPTMPSTSVALISDLVTLVLGPGLVVGGVKLGARGVGGEGGWLVVLLLGVSSLDLISLLFTINISSIYTIALLANLPNGSEHPSPIGHSQVRFLDNDIIK